MNDTQGVVCLAHVLENMWISRNNAIGKLMSVDLGETLSHMFTCAKRIALLQNAHATIRHHGENNCGRAQKY